MLELTMNDKIILVTGGFDPLQNDLRYVHQFCITDNNEVNLSDAISQKIQSVKAYTPDHSHILWDGNCTYEFIKLNFDSEVLWAYDTLIPYSYKVDLAKFCVLYKLGGWCFDLGVELVNPVVVPEHCNAVFFKDEQTDHNVFSHCVIALNALYSEPNNIVFLKAIEKIIEHCKTDYYGFTPIDITGPTMFGKILAQFDHAKKLPNGEIVESTHFGKYVLDPPMNVLRNGYVLCKAKEIVPITDLNPNMNHYPDFWKSNTVYKR